jgi:penicillin V acylase-like amidase (Ntn superfamily)
MRLILLCCLLISFRLEACTRMFWNDQAQAKLVARTMDLFISVEPQIWINPPGMHHQSCEENGLAWTARFGSVSISAFQRRDITTEGVNERGFAVHALVLASLTHPALHFFPADGRQSVAIPFSELNFKDNIPQEIAIEQNV